MNIDHAAELLATAAVAATGNLTIRQCRAAVLVTDHPDHVYHFELGEPADIGEFLRALNASGPGQHHCVVFKTGGGWNRYYWCPEGEDFAEWIQRETAEQRDCGYSWAAFDTSKTAPNKGRVAANALGVKSILFDADVGTDARGRKTKHKTPQYASAHLAAADLAAAWPKLAARNLLPNWVGSSSGIGGFHLHYMLGEASAPEEVTRARHKLRAVLEGADIGLKLDPSVKDSATQVVRIPGSIHGDTGRRYVIYKIRDEFYTLVELDALPAPGAQCAEPAEGDGDKPPAKPKRGRPRKAVDPKAAAWENWEIISGDGGCQIAQGAAVGDFAGYGNWIATGLMLRTEEFEPAGADIFEEVSALDPTPGSYTPGEPKAKFKSFNATAIRCGQHSGCEGCPHNDGSISTPLQLLPKSRRACTSVSAAQLADSVGGAALKVIRDQDDEMRIVVTREREGRKVRSVMHADSRGAKDALRAQFAAGGKTVTDAAIDQALSLLRFKHQEGDKQAVHVRACGTKSGVFVRLRPGYVAHVTAQGVQIVDDAAPGVPLFAGKGGALPDPVLMDSPAAALAHLLAKFMQWGMSEREATMLTAALLAWFLSEGHLPIVEITGGAGSGKSSLAFAIATIFDPSDNLRAVGETEGDVAAAAQGWRLLSLENVVSISNEFAGTLCTVSTGGTLHLRRFYAQGEEIALNVHRAVVVSALTPVCVKPDLQSRVVRIQLQPLAGRTPDSAIKAAIREAAPADFGALLTLLQGALAMLDKAPQGEHRQGDYDLMGEAMLMAAGREPGTFGRMAAEARCEMGMRTVAGDRGLGLVAQSLLTLCRDKAHQAPGEPSLTYVRSKKVAAYTYTAENGEDRTGVDVTPSRLLTEVKRLAGGYPGEFCPKDTTRLANVIAKGIPAFEAIGIRVHIAGGDPNRPVYRFDFNELTLLEGLAD